ncbi:MAG TPA: antitoxin [Actinomycetota bacterium]|nr:antitoxin [Actinomycetota bacterium]
MLERRLQILIDDERYGRLLARARERNLSVAAVVREAIDASIPASAASRAAAARTVLSAVPMPVPAPDDLRAELDELRARGT